MPITDDQVATLRAQLSGNHDEFERQFAQLDLSTNSAGYEALLAAAFAIATERRFQPPVTLADFIRFVADVRARTPSAAEQVDPKIAERLLLSALTDESVGEVNGSAIVTNQMILLACMIADAKPDAADLHQFLTEARELAEEWIA